jgi:hypothetical protein
VIDCSRWQKRRRREDQQDDERRPRGRGEHRRSTSFIAHFRHDAKLNSAKIAGSKPHLHTLQRARDFRGTYHQTTTHHPAAAYLQRPLFCTTYRHCLPPMAMLESLLSRMYGGRTRTVLQ